jgi:hypothetical protein
MSVLRLPLQYGLRRKDDRPPGCPAPGPAVSLGTREAAAVLEAPHALDAPPPWTIEEAAPCFIVRDHNGQALAFVHCEDEPGRRATGKLLTRDEARRIAANIAKLPDLLSR